MKRAVVIALGIALVLGLSLFWYRSVHAPVETEDGASVVLTGPDNKAVTIDVEIADDQAERARGLMDRDRLQDGSGMLFVFDEPQDLTFWMKNTRIPLDILYFDGNGKFVSRTTMSPCSTPECPLYPSDGPARWALEVNAGEPLTAQVGDRWTLTMR